MDGDRAPLPAAALGNHQDQHDHQQQHHHHQPHQPQLQEIDHHKHLPHPPYRQQQQQLHEIDSEKAHLKEVLITHLEYAKYMAKEVERRWRHLCSLQPLHASLLPPTCLGPNLQAQRLAVTMNQVTKPSSLLAGLVCV